MPSKSVGGDPVGVRISPPAPLKIRGLADFMAALIFFYKGIVPVLSAFYLFSSLSVHGCYPQGCEEFRFLYVVEYSDYSLRVLYLYGKDYNVVYG